MKLNINISDEKFDMFKVCANKLLNKCFILKKNGADREQYYFILQMQQIFKEYFEFLDYELMVNENDEIIYLIGNNSSSRLRLKKYESIILLILRLLYVEKKQELSETSSIICSSLEICEKYFALKIKSKLNLDKVTLRDSLAIFKRYNLINVLDRDVAQDDCRIELYPSIFFGLPNSEIAAAYDATQEKIKKYSNGGEIIDETTDEDTID